MAYGVRVPVSDGNGSRQLRDIASFLFFSASGVASFFLGGNRSLVFFSCSLRSRTFSVSLCGRREGCLLTFSCGERRLCRLRDAQCRPVRGGFVSGCRGPFSAVSSLTRRAWLGEARGWVPPPAPAARRARSTTQRTTNHLATRSKCLLKHLAVGVSLTPPSFFDLSVAEKEVCSCLMSRLTVLQTFELCHLSLSSGEMDDRLPEISNSNNTRSTWKTRK